MDAIGRGIIAGFLATLAVSAVFDPVVTLARMAGIMPPTFGWLVHFLVGSLIWGAGFAVLQPYLPGPGWLRGVVFGLAAWLAVMLAVMPLTYGGFFGLALGVATPIVMLVVHLVYGALLGGIFGLLDPTGSSHHHDDEHLHPLPR